MNPRFLDQFRRRELSFDLLLTAASAVGLTLLAYLFSAITLTRDRMFPFHSVSFTLATGTIFFIAMTRGVKHGLYLASGMLTLIGLMWTLYTPMSLTMMLVQWPLIGLFFFGLCVLPNVLPWMYEHDIVKLSARNAELEPKLVELRERAAKLEKQETVERAAVDRKEQVRISSRIAFLNAFAREVLQASSNRELLNLLFHNIMKQLQPEECLLLVLNEESREAIVTRAQHPDHEKLENSRIPLDNPLVAKVVQTREPIGTVPPIPLVPRVARR